MLPPNLFGDQSTYTFIRISLARNVPNHWALKLNKLRNERIEGNTKRRQLTEKATRRGWTPGTFPLTVEGGLLV